MALWLLVINSQGKGRDNKRWRSEGQKQQHSSKDSSKSKQILAIYERRKMKKAALYSESEIHI